jgi:hypothetical protein
MESTKKRESVERVLREGECGESTKRGRVCGEY